MNLEKNEDKKIYSKIPSINKEKPKEEKTNNKLKYNLIWIFLIILFIIIFIQFIFARKTNKKLNQEINLRNMESNEYSIDKSLSYDKNGENIYSQNNVINLNKLDKSYNGINEHDSSKFNNIHIAMSFDNDYYLLSSVTIASLLKNI